MESFSWSEAREILSRTPHILQSLLGGLGAAWTNANEGEGTFSPFDVVGHLIHGERTDWPVRYKKIMGIDPEPKFEPYDRFAQYEESKGKNMGQLLEEFSQLRMRNLLEIGTEDFSAEAYQKIGIHPVFGEVNLKQLLSTWVVHDLNHISQIARVMAKRYAKEVGPWEAFLPILKPRNQ